MKRSQHMLVLLLLILLYFVFPIELTQFTSLVQMAWNGFSCTNNQQTTIITHNVINLNRSAFCSHNNQHECTNTKYVYWSESFVSYSFHCHYIYIQYSGRSRCTISLCNPRTDFLLILMAYGAYWPVYTTLRVSLSVYTTTRQANKVEPIEKAIN